MSQRNLDHLFAPQSVALIGASIRAGSVGSKVMENIASGGFAGPVLPVNPKYSEIGGRAVYRDLAQLPQVPDLAVICTPPRTVPGLVAELGALGTRAAVVLTAGLAREQDAHGSTLQQSMLDAAKRYTLRILGPNCVGLMLPNIGLNASFAHAHPHPGDLAFVSQSGALATAVLDWANSRRIGFSHFVSLGDSADVDFGDVLDYLGSDARTRAVLLYIESVTHARKFMSAARAAARNKPVIVVKSGRVAEGARAAASHTGALAGSDLVYDAAIRRAGMLRVHTIEDLFDAVETLARVRGSHGESLAILTNGGGPGVMAIDELVTLGGKPAELTPATLTALDAVLPGNWSRANPVDIIGDAPAQRYVDAFRVLAHAPEVNAVLMIHAPSAIVPSDVIAAELAPVAAAAPVSVLSCWLGGDGVEGARRCFRAAGLAGYQSPEDAVGAFMQLVNYRRNQTMLTETPPSICLEIERQRDRAAAIVQRALAAGRELLTEPEAKAVLAAYGIPVVPTRVVADSDEALTAAKALGYPVAIKILAPAISHKSDVGGVILNIDDSDELRGACAQMIERVRSRRPDARLDGFTVQQMVRRPAAHELLLGAAVDATFGPVILFGQGGTATEIIADRAIALPPLNGVLARELVERTAVARLLKGYRDRAPADHGAIYRTLLAVSQIVADLPEVTELDINPLLADADGVIALDARVKVERARMPGTERLAIRPYPWELEETVEFDNATAVLRPIRPEDEPMHRAFFTKLQPADIRFRFFGQVKELPHTQLARYTQIDYDREMAFIATRRQGAAGEETLGVVRTVCDPDNENAEFAIIVRSDLKGKGLGAKLMDKIVHYHSAKGTRWLVGQVLESNERMLALARRFGFKSVDTSADVRCLRLSLQGGG